MTQSKVKIMEGFDALTTSVPDREIVAKIGWLAAVVYVGNKQ